MTAFDFLVVSFLNIGDFYRKRQRVGQSHVPQFFTLPVAFVREHHRSTAGWKGELALQKLSGQLGQFEGEAGFELIARALGVAPPERRGLIAEEAG